MKLRLRTLALAAAAALALQAHAQQGPIRIGVLAPVTGPLATPGKDMVEGWKLFWEQNKHTAGGRKVEYVVADTTCNPDQALTQARRLVHQEKVHFLVGPLCGHEGPAVAQVSKETGVPLVMDAAGADSVTKWIGRRAWCAPRSRRARSGIPGASTSTTS
jgi:branched-chain amino acid transport system substrate-binding protein